MHSFALVLKCFAWCQNNGHRIERGLILCVPVYICLSARVRRRITDSLKLYFHTQSGTKITKVLLRIAKLCGFITQPAGSGTGKTARKSETRVNWLGLTSDLFHKLYELAPPAGCFGGVATGRWIKETSICLRSSELEPLFSGCDYRQV